MDLFTSSSAPMATVDSTRHSPDFLLWRASVRAEDWELLISSIIQSRLATDVAGALDYLEEKSQELLGSSNADEAVVWEDFNGRRHTRPFTLLRKAAKPESKSFLEMLFCTHGILSHQVAGWLLQGQTPAHRVAEINGTIPQPRPVAKQLILLGDERPVDFQPLQLSFFAEQAPTSISPNLHWAVPEKQVFELEHLLREADSLLNAGLKWDILYERTRPLFRELLNQLRPIFGQQLARLRQYRGDWADYLTTMTLLTWARIVVQARTQESQKILFSEVPLLDQRYRLSAGRVDAIEVTSIGGHAPKPFEQARLAKLAAHQFRSVAELVSALQKLFGPALELMLGDFKFAIGDFNKPDMLITPGDCPAPNHILQVLRYLTMAPVGVGLSRNSRTSDIWSYANPVQFRTGVLNYYLPTSSLQHAVESTPDERRQLFSEVFAAGWSKAKHRRDVRLLTNRLVGHVLKSFLGNGQHQIRNSNGHQASQIALELASSSHAAVHELVEEHRQFVDSHHIIEKGKHRGKPELLMHVDRLFSAIDAGQVITSSNFNAERGGQICCIMPEHTDSTPSMVVRLDKGYFRCYGGRCGAFGFFAPGSISRDLAVRAANRPRAIIWKENRGILELHIPEECDVIMRKASEIMNGLFFGSAGERYLVEERQLDPYLASSLGVGFGMDVIVDLLLEDGYRFEQLVEYGIVKFSRFVTPGKSLLSRLKRHNLSQAQITRELTIRDKKQGAFVAQGLPVFPLKDRVTFPLTLAGNYVNIYGRATWPKPNKHAKHTKLRVEPGGMLIPHGGFHMEALQSNEPEVIVVEAPINALTLMQQGIEPVIGQGGALNYVLLEIVASSGKNLALGYDPDQGGYLATERAIRWLLERDPKQEVRDFTYTFFREAAEQNLPLDDFNGWWCQQQESELVST